MPGARSVAAWHPSATEHDAHGQTRHRSFHPPTCQHESPADPDLSKTCLTTAGSRTGRIAPDIPLRRALPLR